MIKKIAVLTLAAILLGGCTLADVFKTGDAAKDTQIGTASTSTPAPSSTSDSGLEAIPSVATANDITSLETDINSTVILDEDFSDLD